MIRLFLAMTFLAVCGCAEVGSQSTDSEVQELRAADAALQQAVAAHDLNRIMSFYADNAVLMPTAEPMLSGKAAITEEWKHILAIPDMQNAGKLMSAEVSSGHDLAYTMGTYQSQMMGEDGKQVTEPGKWLSVWKKQSDGAWRIIVDTYNTDIKPPDHK